MLSFIPSFITWDVGPTFFSIGSLEVRFYGLTWALAFIVSLWIFSRIYKREKLSDKMLDSMFWYTILSCIIGARLGHCLFYDPAYYLSNPIEILYIWEGGMASHGAAIGMLVGLWLFSRKNKMPYIWSLDRIGIAVAISGALVRLGNLMNSEIYGRPTDLPWGFRFVRDPMWAQPLEMGGSGGLPVHPTQIYEALAYLVIFFVMWYLYFKKDLARRIPGVMFGIFLIALFLARFIIEFVKNPQVAFEATMTLDMGQWLSIPFIIAGVIILIYSLRKYKNSL